MEAQLLLLLLLALLGSLLVIGKLTQEDYDAIAAAQAEFKSGVAAPEGAATSQSRRRLEASASSRAASSNRTAVILSGQLRSANLTWTGGQIRRNRESVMFGNGDPPTPADCIIEWLFKPLAGMGGFDVFMYMTSNPTAKKGDWNGQPIFFEPVAGETTACEVFSKASVFHDGSGNRFFCLVEPEVQLMTKWVRNFTMWSGRPGGYNSELYNEQALQQYYGHYRANLASKEYSTAHSVSYKYKIRLRPDTPLTRVFPPLSSYNFGPTAGKPCKSTVYYPNAKVGGHNDWFNLGLATDMDKLLDRYVDFTSSDWDWRQMSARKHGAKNYWDLEDHLEALLLFKYEICLEWFVELWVVVIRSVPHYREAWRAVPRAFDWVELSSH